MNDLVRMEELGGLDELLDIALDFELCESFSPPQQLIQTVVLADFQNDVDVLGVLKVVEELNYSVTFDRLVNLDLARKLAIFNF